MIFAGEVERLFKDVNYRQSPQLFRNLGNGTFRQVTRDVGLGALRLAGRGGSYCDFDNDGGLDICVTALDGQVLLLRHEGGNKSGHWLQVKTVGTKSNRDGIGALVKVVAGNLTQYDRVRTGGTFLSGNDLRLHFGLAEHGVADLVEIRWPSGTLDRLTHVQANQALVVQEDKGQIPSPYKPIRRV